MFQDNREHAVLMDDQLNIRLLNSLFRYNQYCRARRRRNNASKMDPVLPDIAYQNLNKRHRTYGVSPIAICQLAVLGLLLDHKRDGDVNEVLKHHHLSKDGIENPYEVPAAM